MHLTKFRALLIVCNVCLTLDSAYSFNDPRPGEKKYCMKEIAENFLIDELPDINGEPYYLNNNVMAKEICIENAFKKLVKSDVKGYGRSYFMYLKNTMGPGDIMPPRDFCESNPSENRYLLSASNFFVIDKDVCLSQLSVFPESPEKALKYAFTKVRTTEITTIRTHFIVAYMVHIMHDYEKANLLEPNEFCSEEVERLHRKNIGTSQ